MVAPLWGYQMNVFQWCLFASTAPFVIIRLYVQFRFRVRPWRELFLVLAWILNLAISVLMSIAVDQDYFRPGDHDGPGAKTHQELIPQQKAVYFYVIIYFNVIYCCKAVLLCFYHDLSPRHTFPKTWWSITVSWVVMVAACLGFTLFALLDCRPITINWTSGFVPDCGATDRFQWAAWIVHLATDLQVYFIPFIILRNLTHLTTGQKRAAYCMFAAGFFNLGCAFFCFGVFSIPRRAYLPTYKGWNAAEVALRQLQLVTAIIVVCLPQVRRLWNGTSEKTILVERDNLNAGRRASSSPRKIADLEAGLHEVDSASVTDESQRNSRAGSRNFGSQSI